MADVDLRIELDRDPPLFEPGEPITGRVDLEATSETEVREVWVRRVYRTPGEGSLDMGHSQRVVLDEARQRLAAGERRSYPFELTAPDGPPTREGELFALEWVVQAGADLPGFRDPSVQEDFTLVDTVVPAEARETPSEPEGELRYVHLADLPAAEAERIRAMPAVEWTPPYRAAERRLHWYRGLGARSRGCVKTCWGCSWAPFLLMALIPLLVGIQALGEGRYGFGIGLLVVLLGVFAFWLYLANLSTGGGIRRWFSERVFGTFQLKAGLDDLRRGGRVVWFVQLEPRRSLRVLGARARLELEERMVERRSSNRSGRLRNLAAVHTFRLDERIDAHPSGEVLLAGNLTLPASWPASLYGNAEFRWTLHVQLELERGPDWEGQVRLDVR